MDRFEFKSLLNKPKTASEQKKLAFRVLYKDPGSSSELWEGSTDGVECYLPNGSSTPGLLIYRYHTPAYYKTVKRRKCKPVWIPSTLILKIEIQ